MEKKYSYNAVHLWLHYHYGHPLECIKCGVKGIKTGRRWSIEWALKPGLEYKKVKDNFQPLCKSCHRRQDYAFSSQMQKNFCKGHLKRKARGLEVPRDLKTGRLIKVL